MGWDITKIQEIISQDELSLKALMVVASNVGIKM